MRRVAELGSLGHTMMLVLEINGGLLHLFSSAAEVESYVEAIDIENGEYEFCDDSGQRFVGEIIQPTGLFRSGRVRLAPVGVPDQTLVASFVSRARTLERRCDGFQTLDDLRRTHVA
jgi:hypothetical protein